ncbi:MAG: ATP-binding cassette domain-containing protein [bacterium]|nr:ATP-binding cassette domain-containing protein [bacterium]
MIRLYHVCKKYDSSGVVLNDISLSIKQGEWIVLRGREKAGKTTLFKLLYGMEEPSSGEMIVCGQNICRIKKEKLYFYRRQLGIIPQDGYLLNDRDLYSNIDLVLRFYGFSSKVRKARVYEVLSIVGLEKKIDIISAKLSDFEKRKLIIARAVVNNPRIILADSPDAGLNLSEQEEIYQIFKRLKTPDMAILFSTKEEKCLLQGLREVELADGMIRETKFV